MLSLFENVVGNYTWVNLFLLYDYREVSLVYQLKKSFYSPYDILFYIF